ncbi:MAG: hypothetical protein K8E24_004765 [Methanobacterium paludis]|nr:hypothetical protein [Methanobacterium paludis]
MEEKNGTGMESGNTINIFQTKYGKIVVFICIDFDRYFFPHINDLNLDFVINPRLDIDKEHRFHKKADIIIDKDDGSREYAFMLQTNAYKTKWGTRNGGGGTAIIGYEHIHRIEKNINWGMRPKKGVKYNLYEVKGELMLITDLKIGPETGRRSKFINWYKYESNQWKALDDNQIWD